MIKVALVDNMNNNFLVFARCIKDKGIDANSSNFYYMEAK
jgi:hypothetical protein